MRGVGSKGGTLHHRVPLHLQGDLAMASSRDLLWDDEQHRIGSEAESFARYSGVRLTRQCLHCRYMAYTGWKNILRGPFQMMI